MTYETRRRHRRHRYARSNPMGAGELALAFISGGLGFVLADFADRYLATYDPSASPAPTNKFTSSGAGTLANTLNIASPPGLMRIGVGVGLTVVPGLLAAFVVKNPMGKAALNGLMIGAGIKLFSSLFNAYVMGNLLKPAASDAATMQKSLGARLYPAEITAAQNIANLSSTPPNTASDGMLSTGGQTQDVGPFALGQAEGTALNIPSSSLYPQTPAGTTPTGQSTPTGTPSGGGPPGHTPSTYCPPGPSGQGPAGTCPTCGAEDAGGCGCLSAKPQKSSDNLMFLGVMNEV